MNLRRTIKKELRKEPDTGMKAYWCGEPGSNFGTMCDGTCITKTSGGEVTSYECDDPKESGGGKINMNNLEKKMKNESMGEPKEYTRNRTNIERFLNEDKPKGKRKIRENIIGYVDGDINKPICGCNGHNWTNCGAGCACCNSSNPLDYPGAVKVDREEYKPNKTKGNKDTNVRRKIREELNKQLLKEAEVCGEDSGPMDSPCMCGCQGTTTRVTYCDGSYTDTDDCGCCGEGKNDENLGTYGTNPNEGPRRHDMEMARRRPYSARYTDMRGSRDMGKMNESEYIRNRTNIERFLNEQSSGTTGNNYAVCASPCPKQCSDLPIPQSWYDMVDTKGCNFVTNRMNNMQQRMDGMLTDPTNPQGEHCNCQFKRLMCKKNYLKGRKISLGC